MKRRTSVVRIVPLADGPERVVITHHATWRRARAVMERLLASCPHYETERTYGHEGGIHWAQTAHGDTMVYLTPY